MKRNNKLISVVGIILISLCGFFINGCARKITYEDYISKCEQTYKPQNTITGTVYYCGTRDGFDYILFSPYFEMDEWAKIESGKLGIKSFPYTSDRSKWVMAYPKYDNIKSLLGTPINNTDPKIILKK